MSNTGDPSAGTGSGNGDTGIDVAFPLSHGDVLQENGSRRFCCWLCGHHVGARMLGEDVARPGTPSRLNLVERRGPGGRWSLLLEAFLSLKRSKLRVI